MDRSMSRRDDLIHVIDALHAEIAALKANDIDALERATAIKLRGIEAVAATGDPIDGDLRELAEEANRLNETCRIYVNLMSANVRRRLQQLTGTGSGAYRPASSVATYA
jgi:hypothetical protein